MHSNDKGPSKLIGATSSAKRARGLSLSGRSRLLAVSATAAVSVMLLAACVAPETTGVGVVVGRHANATAVDTTEAKLLLAGLIADGTVGAVVRNDGEPTLVFTETYRRNPDVAKRNQGALMDQYVSRLTGAVDSALAVLPESAPLEAIARAARAISGSQRRTVFVLDSMLQTAGAMPMQGGRLYNDPADVVEYLKSTKQMPDLSGVELVIYGLGQVAPPQAVLDEASRARLVALWTAVLGAAGATKVTVVESAPGALPSSNLPPVTPVELTRPTVLGGVQRSQCDKTVIPDASVGFLPDLATFVDPPTAEATIRRVSEVVKKCPGRVSVTGTTSSAGTEQGRLDVSKARAAAVAALLARFLGVPVDDMNVAGVGMNFDGFVPDRDASGVLDANRAQQNRQVIISISAPPTK